MKNVIAMSLTAALAMSLLFVSTPGGALAETIELGEHVYLFPDIDPTYYFYTGFRFVDTEDSANGAEYDYLKNSLVIGGEYVAFPFPHRIHLGVDYINENTYFTDLNYAYKNLFLFRGTSKGIYHNLNNITLIDLDPSTPSPGVDRRDVGKQYGMKVTLSNLYLRVKAPNYPLHFFINGKFHDKEGTRQQRFLGGSGWFNRVVRVSESREVNQKTSDITVGVNSHLGPVELEYTHGEKRFESSGDRLMTYDYSGSGYPPGSTRPAGTYPHNLIPDTEGSTETIKIHTSYSGRVVVATTLSWTDRENVDSGARSEHFIGAGELFWLPRTNLTFVLKYKHRETSLNNPDTLPAGYLGFPSYADAITGIKDSISYESDTITGTMRYKMRRGPTLTAKYTHKETERQEAELWEMPEKTTENSVALKASMKLPMKFKLRARFKHTELDEPAHNIDPDNSDKGSVTLSWTPLAKLSAFVSYHASQSKRSNIHYVGMLPDTEAEIRNASTGKYTGSVTYLIRDDLSVTASYAYFDNEVEQDLVFNDSTPPAEHLDPGVIYKDTARSYSAALAYMPTRRLSLSAFLSQTRSKGTFSPGVPASTEPVPVNSFSEVNMRETSYTVSGDYDLRLGWTVGLDYRYNVLDNLAENPDNPYLTDGTAQIGLITLSKRW